MSARDDLVAAEARLFDIATGLRGYADSRGDPVDSEMNQEAFYLESVARLIPSLLALLDAEPVATGVYWCPQHHEVVQDEDVSDDATCLVCGYEGLKRVDLYARPEAAPAKRRTKGQWTELGWIPQPETSDE